MLLEPNVNKGNAKLTGRPVQIIDFSRRGGDIPESERTHVYEFCLKDRDTGAGNGNGVLEIFLNTAFGNPPNYTPTDDPVYRVDFVGCKHVLVKNGDTVSVAASAAPIEISYQRLL